MKQSLAFRNNFQTPKTLRKKTHVILETSANLHNKKQFNSEFTSEKKDASRRQSTILIILFLLGNLP